MEKYNFVCMFQNEIAAKCPSKSKIHARGALSSSSLFLTASLVLSISTSHSFTHSHANPKAAHITLWFYPSFPRSKSCDFWHLKQPWRNHVQTEKQNSEPETSELVGKLG